MAINVWPADAVGGVPEYTGRERRQVGSALIGGATTARPLGARSGVRPGTPTTTVTASSTTWAVLPHVGIIDGQSAAEAGPYYYAVDANVTGAVTAASAVNPRRDLIWARVDDPAEADGSSVPAVVIGYTAGTPAGSPVVPATPARSIALATINVPISGGGSPTVTFTAPYVSAAGGVIPVRTTTERDLITFGTAENPVYVHRLDTNTVEFSVASGTWRPLRTASWSRLDTTNAAVPTITQWGIIRIAGAGTTSITGALTFPEAFAASLPPHVSTNVMGYRATGAYNPNGLTSTGIESWVSKAYAVSNSAASILVASSVAIAAGFDIYVSWSATGQAA